jgi:hypothetical protein
MGKDQSNGVFCLYQPFVSLEIGGEEELDYYTRVGNSGF